MALLDAETVIIVGAGIGGLALGRALHSQGVPFRIVERASKPGDGGLAINLPGNAIAALTTLGLREEIEEAGFPLRRRQYRTSRDKLLFEVDEASFWGPSMQPRSVRRSALFKMLARGLPVGSVRYGGDVQSMSLHQTHAELSLASGPTLNARLVVGADGVRSVVRAQAFGPDVGSGHALLADTSWRFMAPNPGIEHWTVWAGDEGMVLLMPVGPDEVYGWAALTRPQPGLGSVEGLERMTRGFPERVRSAVSHAVAQPGGLYHSPLEEVRLDRWHTGRAVLIGDAAHATAPVWAEGAALAMEDAIVLARLVATNSEVPEALAAFDAQRRPRVAHVQALTDAMSRAAKLPPFVRNALLPFVGPKRYRQTYEPLRARV